MNDTHESAPIQYLQPVTVGGWYETNDGRLTEFWWDNGRVRVVPGREAISRDEYLVCRARDNG